MNTFQRNFEYAGRLEGAVYLIPCFRQMVVWQLHCLGFFSYMPVDL